jgi:hypothetical protein
MSLDIKRLRADASKLQDELSKSPSSRETTGTTKAIRAALPEIYKLRVIAAAMAAQGIVQDKERAPLTTNRLTALVRQIELQNERRNAKRARKAAITASPKKIAMQNRYLSLSPDLRADTRAADSRSPQSEDQIRRLAFERVQRMTEKD